MKTSLKESMKTSLKESLKSRNKSLKTSLKESMKSRNESVKLINEVETKGFDFSRASQRFNETKAAKLIQFKKSPAYIPRSNVPLLLHQSTPTDKIKKNHLAAWNSWNSYMPPLIRLHWTDQDIQEFFKVHYSSQFDFLNSLHPPVLKADLIRYMTVYEYGGIYSDLDTVILKDFEKWIPSQFTQVGMIVGLELESIDSDLWIEWNFARNVQWIQWTFASKPKHSILNKTIELALSRLQNKEYLKNLTHNVF